MAFRISEYRDTDFSDINGSNVWNLDTTVYCDELSDLPGMDDINHYHLVIGCRAIVIATGTKYLLSSSGTWVEDTKSGGGGGGGGGGSSVTVDTQVLPNSTNPVQNQAIYAFVNSSVATNTASFQGTYHSLAELEAVQSPTNNDYGFVIDVQSVILLDTEPADWSTNWFDYYVYSDNEYVPVSGDSAPTFALNTYYKADGVVYKRYKYNAQLEQWEFEYDLNNSSFTAAEWATIQSGLTAADKTKYDGYESTINSKPGLITEDAFGNVGEIFNSYPGQTGANIASGSKSHAEGNSTTASNNDAHAEGQSTTASGGASHAEGKSTTASGGGSHAEGSFTTASGISAHAEGYGTIASRKSQHVGGEYNIADTQGTVASRGKFAFIIGNGRGGGSRSNAYAIDWNGKIYVNNAETGVDVSTLPKQVKLSTGSAIDPDSDKVITIPASDSVSTTSSTTVATSTAVKTAYDEGVTALNYAADTGVKNLVEYNLTVPIELTATVNADGSITVTANTTNVRRLTISTDLSRLEDGKSYILSGCTGGNADTTYHLGITKNNYAGIVYQTNNEVSFTKTSEMALLVLTVRSGQQWTKTFYPMICESTITSSSFRPYAPTNRELYEQFSDYSTVADTDAKDSAILANDGVKNFLKLAPPSTSSGGVSITINPDGTITSTGGTSGSPTELILNNNVVLPVGEYILSGCPTGGADTTYLLDISGTSHYDTGDGVKFTSTGTAITVRIRVGANTSVNDFVWKPMIRRAEITNAEFVSYAPNNHELYEMILQILNSL